MVIFIGPEEIRLELIAHLRLVELLGSADQPVTGVVDQDIDPSESLQRSGDGSIDVDLTRDVEAEEHAALAMLDCHTKSVGIASGGDHRPAGVEHDAGKGAAETRRGTRDQPHPLACHVTAPSATQSERAMSRSSNASAHRSDNSVPSLPVIAYHSGGPSSAVNVSVEDSGFD